jgi:hypothetical protein
MKEVRFRFCDSMLQPLIVMSGLRDRRITREVIAKSQAYSIDYLYDELSECVSLLDEAHEAHNERQQELYVRALRVFSEIETLEIGQGLRGSHEPRHEAIRSRLQQFEPPSVG